MANSSAIGSRASQCAEAQIEPASEQTVDVEESSINLPKLDDSPPDGGYGWACVACNVFINAHTWGINSTYGVFLSYYLNNDYFPNTSALTYAFIGGLSISQCMLVAPLATHIIHLYGTKVCLHLGVVLETVSLIGASFARQKYQILLAQGICFGWGMGFLFVGTVNIIPQWFSKKRSVANSVAAAGSGLGGLMYSLVTQRIIDTMGLAWAFRILGIICFAVNLTAANLLRDRNKQTGARHAALDLKILRRPEFMFVQLWTWFSQLGYTILLFSLPAYARAIGLSAEQGSIVGAVLNLGQMIGRPFIGLSSDRWGRLNLATFLSLLGGLLCIVFWIPAEVAPAPMGLLCFFAIVGGTVAGVFWTTIGPVAAEVLGLQDLPAGLSLTWVLMAPATTFAEPIALELRREHAHSWIYLPPQVFTAVMYLASGLSLWVVRGWKVGQLQWQATKDREDAMAAQRARTLIEKPAATADGQGPDSQGSNTATQDVAETGDIVTKEDIWRLHILLRNMVVWKVV
ncbi:MFS transporter, MCP family, solute carrier family 16, member 7 [Exophiala viscosa]|uniref:MFS transporter, MCP family, solute carrier family 16, member 7 n=1 Tax=Exophiala viscosa TaxID=2486360 RepID=A0AAN6E0T8_9EURO|nr:MFS transporter, MCP family, solute carrier family 16, member 7 [Exophiala viscosa]